MRLLLDTHVLIWLMHDSQQMPAVVKGLILDADEASVSIVSLWEIAIKKSIGKLDEMKESVSEIESACTRMNMRILPITAGALDRIGQLPDIHRDPFDRLLVAMAAEEGLVLVTNDANIRRYDVPTLWDEALASDEVKTTAEDGEPADRDQQ